MDDLGTVERTGSGGMDEIVSALSALTVTVETSRKDDKRAALAQFDVGVAMLKSADPKHPMLNFFQDKQKEWKEKEKTKRDNIGTIVLVAACVAILALGFFACHKLGWLNPENDPIGEWFNSLFKKK